MAKVATEPLTCPFTVVIDSREQNPFLFTNLRADQKDDYRPLTIPLVIGGLKQGDYSVLEFGQWVAVERKSLADLFGTAGRGRTRFERELARLQTLEAAAVVVEGDWEDVLLHPPKYTTLPPKMVFRSVIAWQQRFPKVHWNLMPSRRLAEVFTFRFLERFWKDRQRVRV